MNCNIRIWVCFFSVVISLGLSSCDSGAESAAEEFSGGGANRDSVLSFTELSESEIAVSGSELSCLKFGLSLYDGNDNPIVGAEITVEIVAVSDVKDFGTLPDEQLVTNVNGVVIGQYCAGTEPLKASLRAKWVGLSANSEEFSVLPADQIVKNYIKFGDLSKTKVVTSDSGGDNCIDFQVTLLDRQSKPVAGELIELSVAPSDDVEEGQLGSFVQQKVETNEQGVAQGRYCSGSTPLTASLVAKYGELSTNSAKFQVGLPNTRSLAYIGSSLDKPALGAGQEDNGDGNNESDKITMHLFDSGADDCLQLRFRYEEGGLPLAGEQLIFRTTPSFPRGVKLAARLDAGAYDNDLITNEKRAVFEGVANTAGVFVVPVCAGSELGTFRVEASYQRMPDTIGQAYSPVIDIAGGMPFHKNYSLTFDPVNARTLRGYFNTNSDHTIETSVRLGSIGDGDPISSYPVSVKSEIGRLKLENGGLFDPSSGVAKFSLNALHMVNNYAYPVTIFESGDSEDPVGLAQSRCEPGQIAKSKQAEQAGSYSYKDLSRNWRATVVYATRGQEAFNDANGNGRYDEGGDGFWDRNQNGVYDDGIDELTYDANDDGFDPDGEWFMDLPSPFVDVNEDGVFTAGVDKPLGDDYYEPNKQRDFDTTIWKYEYYPIYMGASFYGLARKEITYNDVDDYTLSYTSKIDSNYVGTLFPKSSYGNMLFWGQATAGVGLGQVQSHFFAHGICGNLMPGGTQLSLSTEMIFPPEYGAREVTHYFRLQPGDALLEPARWLLTGTGDADAEVNFNAVDHPSAEESYPVFFVSEIAPCTNQCTGAVATAGVACDGASMNFRLDIAEPEEIGGDKLALPRPAAYGSVQTCICAAGATFSQGACTCKDGTEFNGVDACVETPQ